VNDQQDELPPEDIKIITLARSSWARRHTIAGAAVRDRDGRTYTGSDVDLPSFKLSALQAAVAAAVSSGASTLAAAAVVTTAPAHVNVQPVADLGGIGVPVYVAGVDGVPTATLRT
jgi:cytidine deaminase